MQMEFIPYLLMAIIIFNIALGLSIVFLERKDASAAWAWLMVLLFVPVAGFFLYLIFGRRLSGKRIFTWDAKAKLGVKKIVRSQLRAIENDEFIFNQLEEYKDLYYLHLRNDDAIFTQDNDVEIFVHGSAKFQSLLDDMEKAKDHIHLLYYIIRNDELGQRIADVLIKKAQEGVEVRVLYDALGTRYLRPKYLRKLRKSGVELAAFFPSFIPKINFKVNYRNHRKLAIIDGEVGYIGGFNIGDEYLGKSKKFGYWRDTHL